VTVFVAVALAAAAVMLTLRELVDALARRRYRRHHPKVPR
jgi:hypothetical protein